MLQIDLSGKIAVVTGGAGQLGRVMVRTLAECGADVAIHYLSSEAKAAELKSEVEAMGRRAFTVQADVTKEADVFTMRDKIGEVLRHAANCCNKRGHSISTVDEFARAKRGRLRKPVSLVRVAQCVDGKGVCARHDRSEIWPLCWH